MADRRPKIRLFVEASLSQGAELRLTDQAHYLVNVMRQGVGDVFTCFNGRDGAWTAEVAQAGKRQVVATCLEQTEAQRTPPDLWLLFAPIKKARTDFIVEKAAELGVARVQPVLTRFTNAERVRTDRLRAHAIEAAEQCGETWVPDVVDPGRLDALLDDWPDDRLLIFCDEARSAPPMARALRGRQDGRHAILIGPEGGFSPDEAQRLHGMPGVLPVSLGPRVLRADTAAVAALAVWQSTLGDWQ